jgi:membrane protease YdiL (CAAX protease family)
MSAKELDSDPGADRAVSDVADLQAPYLAHALRGRNAPWRYLVGFLTAIVVMTLGAVAIAALQAARLLPFDFTKGLQDPGQAAAFYPATGLLFGLLLLGFVVAARLIHGKRFTDVIGAWRWPLFVQGLAVWIPVLAAGTLIDFLIAPAGFTVTANAQTPKLALLALGGLAIQTFAEEFAFRGYLTQGLLAGTRRIIPTVLISGALFGAMHIPNGLPQAVSATVFGVVLAWIAIRTGGLAFTSGLHLANNLFGAVVLVSADDAFRGSAGVLTQSTPHLMWWDTAVGAVGLLLVAAWVYRRTAKAGASAT